jgi:hypothetical protein
MRPVVAALAVSIILTGCGRAVAAQPDNKNPGHCLAALNYGNFWLGKGGDHTDMIQQGTARGMFEMLKSRSKGQSKEEALAEGVALTKAYGNDRDKMMALLEACMLAEDADPQFQTEYPRLLAVVRANPSLAK